MAQQNHPEQLRFSSLPSVVPATVQAPYSTATMDFRSAIRKALSEEVALLLPMSPSTLVCTAPIIRGNFTLRDAVRKELRSLNQEAMIFELPRARLDVQPTECSREIVAASKGDAF